MHAATRIEAEDRAGLERLCRYVTRPPLAAGRLQCIEADHLTFRLKTPWSDGTTHHRHHVWTWDFIFDRTDKGGTLKMMTLLDEYTRQSLAIQVERQRTATQVLEAVLGSV